MSKKLKQILFVLCFASPFFITSNASSFQVLGGGMTFCWPEPSEEDPNGGFYQCNDEGCEWVEGEPGGESQECDQFNTLFN